MMVSLNRRGKDQASIHWLGSYRDDFQEIKIKVIDRVSMKPLRKNQVGMFLKYIFNLF